MIKTFGVDLDYIQIICNESPHFELEDNAYFYLSQIKLADPIKI